MVGAQNAIKIASIFFPLRKSTSETMIIDTTTKSMMQFMTPTLSINDLNIKTIRNICLTKLLIKT